MIDANSKFFAILTDVGAAKLANANVLGVPWNITEMGLGDANDTEPQPSAKQTKLINEWRRRPLNQLRIDPVNPAVIIAEQVIPADEGGHWIREVGLYDADGDLVAVANCAPSFKPVLSQGSGRTQVVRMNLIVSSTAQISLKIDPSVVLATREYVDSRILEELSKLDIKQSVRAATTANIALVGLQVVDGVSLNTGDRVLVKNQAAAKDNGPYVVAVGAWARAKDADNNAKVTPNLTVAVEVGATQADTIWQLVTDGPIVVGTTALTFKDITDGLARLFSPSFAGNPTAPTPARFDNSKSVATTEFVKQRGIEFSGFTTNSANLVMTATHVGGLHSFSDAAQLTATLPPTAGVSYAATITLACAGPGGLKIVASGTDLVYTSSGVSGPLVLALGDTAEFVRLQDQWRLVGGTVALRFAGTMSGPHFVTPPKFDNSLRLATTEFAQRSQGSYADSVAYNGSTTLTAADVGRLVAIGGTSATVTLPDAGPVPLGAVITVLASTTAGLTIQAKAGQSLLSLSSVSGPFAVLPSSMSVLRRLNDGTGWVLEDGDSALKYSPLFASSIGGSGWFKRPDGLIEQWGQGVTDANGYVYVTFPIPFPYAPRNITMTHVGSMSLMHALMGANLRSTGCTLRVQNAAGASDPNWTVWWRAIGQ
ncbi:phage tail protein [Pseudomonas anatoliensis]|uniref:phage tail protein n=1 Tax=Pseudomonas anatoliensis TaxID=2710589 RepID=UPI001B333178|nr:phage tail protein [Pseudomonas anatoliensis]MBP5954139.1 phage tail protein [Pseudomonas anatoliensis]